MIPLVSKKPLLPSVHFHPHFAAYNRTSHTNQCPRIVVRLAKSTRAPPNDSLGAYFRTSAASVGDLPETAGSRAHDAVRGTHTASVLQQPVSGADTARRHPEHADHRRADSRIGPVRRGNTVELGRLYLVILYSVDFYRGSGEVERLSSPGPDRTGARALCATGANSSGSFSGTARGLSHESTESYDLPGGVGSSLPHPPA